VHRRSVLSECLLRREGHGEFSDLLFVYVFIYIYFSYLSLFKHLLPPRIDTMYDVQKPFFCAAHEGVCGAELQLHSFLTSALDGGE